MLSQAAVRMTKSVEALSTPQKPRTPWVPPPGKAERDSPRWRQGHMLVLHTVPGEGQKQSLCGPCNCIDDVTMGGRGTQLLIWCTDPHRPGDLTAPIPQERWLLLACRACTVALPALCTPGLRPTAGAAQAAVHPATQRCGAGTPRGERNPLHQRKGWGRCCLHPVTPR